jgi:adenylate cyclase class 2
MATRGGEEVEIKVAVGDRKAFARLLKDAGFRVQTPRTFESNSLYDLPTGRLRRRGELLRIRRYGKDWTLTFKAKGKSGGHHKRREEIETKLVDGRKLEEILLRTGMTRSFVYEKYRTEFTDGRGHVVLDETPIGDFAEIEGPPRWIDATAKKLGMGIVEYITGSYAELFFAWKHRTRSSAHEMTFAAVKPVKPLTRRR